MKKIFLKIVVSLLLIGISTSSCDKGAATAIDTFIPNFTNGYGDIDHPNVLFFFSATGTNTEGSFTGTENDNNTSNTYNFNGTYKNSYMEFKYSDGPRLNKKFTGTFDKTTTNPYKITVKNGSDVIHLQSL